jgi:glyceraldehyde-3-phosphate dehydrogenase type I
LPWAELGVDLVLECTGVLRDRAAAAVHLRAGAGRVLVSNPADAAVDATVVYGVNHEDLSSAHQVVSNASCSTNCVVPVLQVLERALGIEHGVITTVHSAMNDQPAVDSSHHSDLRRSRSALHSIIPVDTALARGIERLLPNLAGRFEAVAMRVPTINVSVIDLTVQVRECTSAEAVNHIMRRASRDSLRGILGYTEEPLASCDFNHDPRSVIIDGSQTRVSGERLVKVLCWFDNEWGFANRMLDTGVVWLDKVRAEERGQAVS